MDDPGADGGRVPSAPGSCEPFPDSNIEQLFDSFKSACSVLVRQEETGGKPIRPGVPGVAAWDKRGTESTFVPRGWWDESRLRPPFVPARK